MASTKTPGLSADSDFELKRDDGSQAVNEDFMNSRPSSLADSDKAFLRTEGNEDYEPIDTYEGKHRWDPSFQWEPEEEKKVLRKIDLRICTWVCLAFFALQLDRANIQQALTDNFLKDLGLNTNNYNYGQTMYFPPPDSGLCWS